VRIVQQQRPALERVRKGCSRGSWSSPHRSIDPPPRRTPTCLGVCTGTPSCHRSGRCRGNRRVAAVLGLGEGKAATLSVDDVRSRLRGSILRACAGRWQGAGPSSVYASCFRVRRGSGGRGPRHGGGETIRRVTHAEAAALLSSSLGVAGFSVLMLGDQWIPDVGWRVGFLSSLALMIPGVVTYWRWRRRCATTPNDAVSSTLP
jgi:hypothetical protein